MFLFLIRLLFLPYLDNRYTTSRRWLLFIGVPHWLVLVATLSPLLVTGAICRVDTVAATGRIIGGATCSHVALIGIWTETHHLGRWRWLWLLTPAKTSYVADAWGEIGTDTRGHGPESWHCVANYPAFLLLLTIASITLWAHAQSAWISSTSRVSRVPTFMLNTSRVKLLPILSGLLSLNLKPLRLLDEILNQYGLFSDGNPSILAILIIWERLHVLQPEQIHLEILSESRRAVLQDVLHGSQRLQDASPLVCGHVQLLLQVCHNRLIVIAIYWEWEIKILLVRRICQRLQLGVRYVPVLVRCSLNQNLVHVAAGHIAHHGLLHALLPIWWLETLVVAEIHWVRVILDGIEHLCWIYILIV